MKTKVDPTIDLSLGSYDTDDEHVLESTRAFLTSTFNRLMVIELTEFLGYEKSARSGKPNARNGFYSRPLETPASLIKLKIPRDRKGQFSPSMFPKYSRECEMAGYLAYDLCEVGFGRMDMDNLAQKHFGISYSEKAQRRMIEIVSEEIARLQDHLKNPDQPA